MAQRQREDRLLLPGATPAPAAATGEAAVGRSRREDNFAQARALSTVTIDGAMLADSIAAEGPRPRSGINPTRRLGGRLFILRDGGWTDLRHADSLRTVRVEPFSAAYFAVLRALPELVEPAELGMVLVAGKRVSVRIEPGGQTQWQAGELERVVREFRS